MIPVLLGGGKRRKTASLNDAVAVPGQTLTDNLGNVWGINGAAQATFNGAAQTYTAGVVALAWVDGVMWQENSSNNWYSFTVTNGVAAWSGVGPVANPLPTITGITLSGNSFANGAASGTVIGTLGVTATGGTFSFALGSLTLAPSATGLFAILPGSSGGGTGTTGVDKTAIMSWLSASVIGKGAIPVQHLLGQTGDISAVTSVYNATGKYVGGIGCSYYNDDVSKPATKGTGYAITIGAPNTAAISWWNAGGLVWLSGFAWPSPLTTGHTAGDGGGSAQQAVNGADLITPGTATYNNWRGILDDIAVGITQLVNAGVVAMFRPLHEQNGNWFWWGTGITDAQFVTLWQQMHDYYTTTYKFGANLIWIYSVNGTNSLPNRYPGAAYVDVVGFDDYTSTPGNDIPSCYSSLTSLNKPIAMCEWGAGSPSGSAVIDETIIVNALKATPNVFYWEQWSTGWGIDKMTAQSAAMNDTWTLTRERLNRPAGTTVSSVPGNAVLTLAASGAAGSYSVPVTATQTLLPGSPYTQTFTVAGASLEAQAGSTVSTVGPTINASPTPGASGYGNLISLTSGAQIAVNGSVIGVTSGVNLLYYIGSSCFQRNTSNNWYGPIKVNDAGGAVGDPRPTVVLSNTTVAGNTGSGTVVGALSVSVGAGSYAWSYSLSGSNAGSFMISGV